jgi:hypothetical protein
MAKKDYNAINFKNKDVDKFTSKFGQGDPIKLKNSPLSGNGVPRDQSNGWDPLAKAHYTASTALSASDHLSAKNQLKKEDPSALSSYGYKDGQKSNANDFVSNVKGDAVRLRKMASGRPIGDVNRSANNKSLVGRKLAEGIQAPSMSKAKKPIIEAPKVGSKKK